MSDYAVYVLDINGEPLMPTKRFGKVRWMLKTGKAKAVCSRPFTIQLQYEPKTHVVQEVIPGINPSRSNQHGMLHLSEPASVYSMQGKTAQACSPQRQRQEMSTSRN